MEATVDVSLSANMAEVHAAWLTAGARGDVAAMRQLMNQYPQWLDLQQVRPTSLDSTSRGQARLCTWREFHLRTLGASALHTAAWEGNVEIIQFLLELGQNPDTSDYSAMTPTMVAILRLNLMTMRCVFLNGEAVRRNAVVNCQEKEDMQRRTVIAVLQLLLHFGANVDARSQDGKTALHYSTGDDAFEVAKFLLDAGANIDIQDKAGKTPLHYCIQEGGLLVTDLLLSSSANINVEDNDGATPLKLVVQQANVNVLQIFLNHFHLVATPQRLNFASALLMQAVDNNAEEVVRYIVENEYASVTITNEAGETPLHRATLTSSPAMMEMLIGWDPAGDNFKAVTVQGETPVHYAARYGSAQVMEELLQCISSMFSDLLELEAANPVNAVNRNGETPLCIVGTSPCECKKGKFIFEAITGGLGVRDAKVQLLLQHGARLFSKDFLAHELLPANAFSNMDASHITLPVQVQSCLRLWLLEDDVFTDRLKGENTAQQYISGSSMEELTKLCMEWVASVPNVGPWPSILICAGYAHEMVPLLVGSPLRDESVSSLLRQIKKFGRHHSCSDRILELHDELWEA